MTNTNWEDTFRAWGGPPSKTEKEKMENTERAIQTAINKDDMLSQMDVSIFAQGSYKSRTNVRLDSDVDVCIRLNSTFYTRYPKDKTREDYGNIAGSISFAEYKKLVEMALKSHFGSDKVTRGNKAISIQSSSYRVNADAVPALAYHYYYGSGENDFIKPVGIGILTDKDIRINNWPKQVYENGVDKQNNTSERYKKMVRIMKKMRNQMQDEDITSASDISSFLIESLVWNVPYIGFNHENYYDDIRYVIADCFNKTIKDENCKEMREVNNIKSLFHLSQPWTRDQAHGFFSSAWDFVGFD